MCLERSAGASGGSVRNLIEMIGNVVCLEAWRPEVTECLPETSELEGGSVRAI